MSSIGRDTTRTVLLIIGLGFLGLLGVGLLWLHLDPSIALALTLGGIVLVLLSLRPILGLHGFVILMFLESIGATAGGITLIKMLGVVIVAGWLASLALRRKMRQRVDGFTLAALLFVAWTGVSLVYAYDSSIGLSRLLTFAQLILVSLMFRNVVDSVQRMAGVCWAIVIWSTTSTTIAVAMYYLGVTQFAVGLAGNRNVLALFINIAIVCAYILYQMTEDRTGRIVLTMCLPVLFLGLALTLSRTGLLVLFGALLAVWYRVARERGFAILLSSAAVICVIVLLLPGAFWARAETIVPTLRRQEDTFGMRVRLWKLGLRMIEDRPIVGVGPGNFAHATPRYARGEMLRSVLVAHNSYISVAAEMGLVGLGLFLLIHERALRAVGMTIRNARQTGRKDLELCGIMIEVSIVVIMAAGLTGSREALKCLWILFGMALAAGDIAGRATAVQAADRRHDSNAA